MKYLYLTLILLFTSSASLAKDLPITLNIFDLPLNNPFQQSYPEEEHKKIDVYKERSPLEYSSQETNYIETLADLFDNSIVGEVREQVTNFGFNKFSMGTGAVDVTFQVKNGVKYAIKDTLAGYPEYQRRKITEEILNSNLNSHINTEKFISGNQADSDTFDLGNIFGGILSNFGDFSNYFNFDHSNLVLITRNLLEKRVSQDLFNFFQIIAYILLSLFTTMRTFKNIRPTREQNESYSQIIYDSLICLLLISFLGSILDMIIRMITLIQAGIHSIIETNFINLELDYFSLERSWENISNHIGYMPALILSIIDSLSQVFVYFYVIGLIIFIILGKIISPLWALTIMSRKLKQSFFENLFKWSKCLFSLTMIPLIFLLAKLFAQEFNDIDNGIFEVVISIIGFILLPLSLNIFKIMK